MHQDEFSAKDLPRPSQPAVPRHSADPPSFARRALLVAAIGVVLLLLMQLQDVFVLLFGALIFATALGAAAVQLERYTGLPWRWSVLVTVLIVLLVMLLGGWAVGDRLASELENLRERLPDAIDAFRAWLSTRPLGDSVLDTWSSVKDGGVPWSRLIGAAGLTFGAIGNAILMLILAVYLAIDPQLYRNGVVRLFPVTQRIRVRDALQASGEGLSRWLLGQGVSMLFVGTSTAAGLALLGMPLALSLGAIAGVLAFVPFFGPIASGLLAVLIAFTEGTTEALYVAILCFGIQQVEGNVLMPFVQRWAVDLPPVLGMVSVLIFGLFFGPMGVIFATPLMVVLMILVQRVYVEDLLEGNRSHQLESSN